MQGPVAQETVAEGDAQAGGSVYESQNCGSCHTYGPANATGTIGPNLDESLEGDDAQSIYMSIVNPDGEITEGFNAGIMPKTYSELSDEELANLVAFLNPS